ncbi:hypothetical protein BBK82_03230 [Lentzea guizhouensis]|uniref:Uncharacterized protein n=2 Tax=Lentzea guizhouensis TaxID=1586287 RepID=A0A1B2HBX8_9PSEU|nr:hypothetical protein BBK82_03230 [Lentzea guizhouensis]
MPPLGSIVQYTLSEHDIRNAERTVQRLNTAAQQNLNTPRVGDVYPAMVLRDFGACVNLRVHLDGGPGAELWVTSVSEGDGPGHWTRQ